MVAKLLERDHGSLIRHVAMVVPHEFSRTEGRVSSHRLLSCGSPTG